MAIADNENRDLDSGGAWGTLEELLLACAVSRYGTESWDSVSMEVLKRTTTSSQKSSHNNFLKAFTPHDCEQRYQALKRRFDEAGKRDGDNDVVGERDLREEKLPFMIDELKKLRVEELRREVERRDISIVSLQLKVKRLEEEREKSSLKAEDEADLVRRPDRKSDAGKEPDGSLPELADKSISMEPSDEPEDRSFNESNSGNRTQEQNVTRNLKPDPVQPVVKSEPDKDVSSSRGVDKVVGRTSQAVRPGDPSELRASVSESKKQSSDVQSSASLPRRKRRSWRRSNGATTSSDEIEVDEELSSANKKINVKSQPLVKFLEIVRSHKHGLVFHRRLPSQETQKYRNLIRQHMDLETLESNLDRGIYCDCHPRFYRDLLLIFTNAVLFFRKSTTEHLAARELQRLVTKEIVALKPKSPPQKPPVLAKLCLETQIPDPVNKSKSSTPTNIVVCRRRRNSSSRKTSEEMKTSTEVDEEVENESLKSTKTNDDVRKKSSSSNVKDEPMKLKRERSNSSGNNNVNNNDNKDERSSDEEDEPINKRRNKLVSSKKEGVVNFLKRMKQNSPSKETEQSKPNVDDSEDETTKIMDLSKKKVLMGKKMDATTTVSVRRSTRGEESGRSEMNRRGGGKRPARKAAMGGGTPDSGRLKKRGDGEVPVATTSGKKKPRK